MWLEQVVGLTADKVVVLSTKHLLGEREAAVVSVCGDEVALAYECCHMMKVSKLTTTCQPHRNDVYLAAC